MLIYLDPINYRFLYKIKLESLKLPFLVQIWCAMFLVNSNRGSGAYHQDLTSRIFLDVLRGWLCAMGFFLCNPDRPSFCLYFKYYYKLSWRV